MNLETTSHLDPSTINGVQDLIQINSDSSKGFREAAERVDAESLKALFTEMASAREANVTELQKYVQINGGQVRDASSIAAAFHRIWIDFRGLLSGGDSLAILSEAERGEDHIKAAYEHVLVQTAGSALNDVVTHQYAKVKAGHDKIRDLRDGYK